MAAIAEREREVSDIIERVVSSSEDSIRTRVAAMRAAAKLKDLRALLGGDVAAARTALLNHVDGIHMQSDGKVYTANGSWSFLRQRPTDGAGGQNRTGYARLFRAALYQ